MQQRISRIGAHERVENRLAGQRGGERNEAAGEQFCVHADVRVGADECGRGEAAQAEETREDFIMDDRETGPGMGEGVFRGGKQSLEGRGIGVDEGSAFPDDLGEDVLE
jgi:hypothetical protein